VDERRDSRPGNLSGGKLTRRIYVRCRNVISGPESGDFWIKPEAHANAQRQLSLILSFKFAKRIGRPAIDLQNHVYAAHQVSAHWARNRYLHLSKPTQGWVLSKARFACYCWWCCYWLTSLLTSFEPAVWLNLFFRVVGGLTWILCWFCFVCNTSSPTKLLYNAVFLNSLPSPT